MFKHCVKFRNNIYYKVFNEKYWTLKDFNIEKKITNDEWNRVKDGEIHYNLINNKKHVGHFRVRLKTGQVGIAHLDKEYRGYGIGYQMIKLITNDKINFDGKSELFAVTDKGHYFWKKLPNSVYKLPADDSITGGGYRFDVNE